MSGVHDFKALLNKKLAVMAQEISQLFDRMIVQHEREMQVLKKKNTRQQQLLDAVMKPRVVLRRSDLQVLSHCRAEDGPRLDKGTERPHVKEEQEQVSIKQEQEELQVSIKTLVSVKSEDDEDKPIAIPQRHNTDGHHGLQADEQSPKRSDGVKHIENSFDSEDETEITDSPSTSSTGLDSIAGHALSDSEALTQAPSDTEDEWRPEPQPTKNAKRAVVKQRFGKNAKTKRSLDNSTGKQRKSVSDEGSEIIFECTQCLKTFLRKTCSVRDTQESTTCCSACRAKSMPVHRQKKRCICSICKKGFTRSDNLSSHMLIHKGERPHSCKVCKKSFKEPGHLKAHVLIHTGEKPFHCSVCKKSFRHRATRDRHQRNHQGKRPFSCSQCGAEFKQKAHYLSHLVIHSGERPFSCTVCKKTYTRKSHVTSHMMQVHSKKQSSVQNVIH